MPYFDFHIVTGNGGGNRSDIAVAAASLHFPWKIYCRSV